MRLKKNRQAVAAADYEWGWWEREARRRAAYFDALKRLGLPPTDPNTALALGVKLRQVQRYAAGELEPPLQVLLLLRCYVRQPALLDEVLAQAE